jgi:hypothetical protein
MTESVGAGRGQARAGRVQPGPQLPEEESPTLAAYLIIAIIATKPAPDQAPAGRRKGFLRCLRSLHRARR